MTTNRKQLIQIGLGLLIIILIVALVAFGGGALIETFKEMHGM